MGVGESMTAQQLLELLREKHSKDVFVPECKDGPTTTAQHTRLDAWVMPRSWRHPATTGYEIKVSRRDFLADTKWPAYLDLCHCFYFVAAPGVIQLNEVPEQAGLLVASSTGTKLFTKKKAPMREVQIPEDLWRYVLMCRARITREHEPEAPVDWWRRWLAERDDRATVGRASSRRLARLVRERIDKVESENARLGRENERLQEVKRVLSSMGLDSPHSYAARRELEERAAAMAASALPPLLIQRLDAVIRHLGRAREVWEDLGQLLNQQEIAAPGCDPLEIESVGSAP